MALRFSKKEILTDIPEIFHKNIVAPNRAIGTPIFHDTSTRQVAL